MIFYNGLMEYDSMLDARPKSGECRSFSGGSAICGVTCKRSGVSQTGNGERIPEEGKTFRRLDRKEKELRRREVIRAGARWDRTGKVQLFNSS